MSPPTALPSDNVIPHRVRRQTCTGMRGKVQSTPASMRYYNVMQLRIRHGRPYLWSCPWNAHVVVAVPLGCVGGECCGCSTNRPSRGAEVTNLDTSAHQRCPVMSVGVVRNCKAAGALLYDFASHITPSHSYTWCGCIPQKKKERRKKNTHTAITTWGVSESPARHDSHSDFACQQRTHLGSLLLCPAHRAVRWRI